jgi:hypothetical protein
LASIAGVRTELAFEVEAVVGVLIDAERPCERDGTRGLNELTVRPPPEGGGTVGGLYGLVLWVFHDEVGVEVPDFDGWRGFQRFMVLGGVKGGYGAMHWPWSGGFNVGRLMCGESMWIQLALVQYS